MIVFLCRGMTWFKYRSRTPWADGPTDHYFRDGNGSNIDYLQVDITGEETYPGRILVDSYEYLIDGQQNGKQGYLPSGTPAVFTAPTAGQLVEIPELVQDPEPSTTKIVTNGDGLLARNSDGKLLIGK